MTDSLMPPCNACGSPSVDCGHREPELVIHYKRVLENFERRRLARLAEEIRLTRELAFVRAQLLGLTTQKETNDALPSVPARRHKRYCSAAPVRNH